VKIAVLDLETDPFEYGQMVHPFVAGFYDGQTFISWWSADCVQRSVEYLLNRTEPCCIYAHNGGRFDFFYYLPHIHDSLRIVNGRIIQAKLGHHEVRDSYAIMPFALEQYKKTPIDYATFKRGVREKHRENITSYLRDDCTDLYDLCVAFREEFGDKLTIGSASMQELKKFHTFRTGSDKYDAKLRTKFYYGGRNQVFCSGVVYGAINVYDVNSMYPSVMRDSLHPVSTGLYRSTTIDDRTCFVSVEGTNQGAFCVRSKTGGLDFTTPNGIFHTTIHEYNAAIDTGTFRPKRIVETIGFSERISFDEFVDHFYNARARAKAEGDKIRTLFYKFVMNSAYGKFGQNPLNYSDWYITHQDELPPEWHDCTKACEEECRLRWSPSYMCNEYIIWSKPLQALHYFNIATGSSITGAARAVLLRGLSCAVNPMYCDTDSIICESLDLPSDDTTLGAWKLEATGAMAAIAGKKLYAIFDANGTCIKKAHKGARLEGNEILRIAQGQSVESRNPVPRFHFDGSHSFTKRVINSTT
jgi:DNA polymerase type B, organellar and viral